MCNSDGVDGGLSWTERVHWVFAGLSLQSQYLTGLFLGVRLFCR